VHTPAYSGHPFRSNLATAEGMIDDCEDQDCLRWSVVLGGRGWRSARKNGRDGDFRKREEVRRVNRRDKNHPLGPFLSSIFKTRGDASLLGLLLGSGKWPPGTADSLYGEFSKEV